VVAHALEGLSQKSRRLLEDRGVTAVLATGCDVAVTGRPARLGPEGPYARLAFRLDPGDRLRVGFAVSDGLDGPWTAEGGEFEPFTLRTYGYYRRYIQRHRPIEGPGIALTAAPGRRMAPPAESPSE
jgi:hypothetical protein